MIEFSAALEAKGLPTRVTSQQDIDVLMTAFEDHLKSLDLWQYYVLDVKAERESVLAALKAGKAQSWDGVAHKSVVELAGIVKTAGSVIGLGTPEKRFGTHVEGPAAAGLVRAAFVDLQDDEALADAWIRVVDVINVPLYEEWNDDTKAALDNIKNRLKYARLDDHGPKLGPITKEYVDEEYAGISADHSIVCLSWKPTSLESRGKSRKILLLTRLRTMGGFGMLTLSRILLFLPRRHTFAAKS